jgi:hypothetical protein
LDAALGKGKASEVIATAHEEQAATEKQIADLEYALTEAGGRLQDAKHLHAAAQRERGREMARALIARRIEAARKFDVAAMAMEAALEEFDALGSEIQQIPEWGRAESVSASETVIGVNRVAASLPVAVKKILGLETTTSSLARTEELIWRSVI